ncbi:MAG: glycoside hydrolase, family 8 [Ilumatobacteraceae bacterium]|nr:glycoside hydrolase, family 8 [Ilumatobacteraceae bacterium]
MTPPRQLMRRLAPVMLLALPMCGPATSGRLAPRSPAVLAVDAADRFLDDHLTSDGRVLRSDQGGDTVSEGQAYAMLLAVGAGDEGRFRLAWQWAADHLQRADGLLGWRWSEGRVVDDGAATDADLIAAWALGLAGRRFRDPDLTGDAERISRAVLAMETVSVPGGRMLVAGPWATNPRVVNPSYLVVEAMSQLWWLTHDPAWSAVAAASRRLLAAQTAVAPHLPTDWSTVDGVAADAPDGTSPRFSYDAARALVQLAADCDADGRAIAAAAWPFFASIDADRIVASYSPQGAPKGPARHPITVVAAAAAAHAAGDQAASENLLDQASALDAAHPTYYGSAWVAIARVLLDTRLLGGCA